MMINYEKNKKMVFDLEKILNDPNNKKSPFYSRFVKFLSAYPSSIPLFNENITKPLKDVCAILYDNGITNRGKPYSTNTISIILSFLK